MVWEEVRSVGEGRPTPPLRRSGAWWRAGLIQCGRLRLQSLQREEERCRREVAVEAFLAILAARPATTPSEFSVRRIFCILFSFCIFFTFA